ncbi:MAG TPA: hypothetical protein VGF99_21810 [Myxococcota bacterium]
MSTAPASTIEETGGFAAARDRKEFPCESCGAPLVFHIGAQRLKCEHCGFEKALVFAEDARPVGENDLDKGLALQASRRSAPSTDKQEVRCRGCGAIVVFDGSLTSSSCSYCDTPLQVKDAHVADHPIRVDGIATFQVEDREAKEAVRAWVKGRWFAPGAWKKRGVDGRFDGVYMPFFTFDAMTFTRYSGERGDAYYVEVGSGEQKRRERRVRWSHAAGAFQRFFDDVCIPALQSLPQALLQGLEPWPTDKLLPFTDSALAGKRAHTYEKDLSTCFGLAKARIEDELRRDVRQRIGGDEQRVHSQDTQYSALTYKHVLLPVWVLAYRYGDKPFRVVVNAVTGQVHGERPWSIPKIVAFALFVAAVVFIFVSMSQQHPR